MAAAVATNLGWQAVYLGSEPAGAAEIAGAALQNGGTDGVVERRVSGG